MDPPRHVQPRRPPGADVAVAGLKDFPALAFPLRDGLVDEIVGLIEELVDAHSHVEELIKILYIINCFKN